MENTSYFGRNVVAARDDMGLTRVEFQRRLAQEGVKVHMTVLRRIEAGEREPRLAEAIAMARVLHLDVEDLVAAPDTPESLTAEAFLAARHYRESLDVAMDALDNCDEKRRTLVEAVRVALEAGAPKEDLQEAAVIAYATATSYLVADFGNSNLADVRVSDAMEWVTEDVPR